MAPIPHHEPPFRRGRPPYEEILQYVQFHHSSSSPREVDLVFDFRGLPAQLRVSFKLTSLNSVKPLRDSVIGLAKIHRPKVTEWLSTWTASFFRTAGLLVQRLGCWIENFGRGVARLPLKSCKPKPQPNFQKFAPAIYEVIPSALVRVSGVRIPTYGFCAALLSIQNGGTLEDGSEYYFQVRQQVKEVVVGGSSHVLRVAGEKKRPSIIVPP